MLLKRKPKKVYLYDIETPKFDKDLALVVLIIIASLFVFLAIEFLL